MSETPRDRCVKEAGLLTSTCCPASLAQWTIEEPTVPGTYWLRHGVFHEQADVGHEPHPILVEVLSDGKSGLTVHVPGTDRAWALSQMVVGEWAGPLVPFNESGG